MLDKGKGANWRENEAQFSTWGHWMRNEKPRRPYTSIILINECFPDDDSWKLEVVTMVMMVMVTMVVMVMVLPMPQRASLAGREQVQYLICWVNHLSTAVSLQD